MAYGQVDRRWRTASGAFLDNVLDHHRGFAKVDVVWAITTVGDDPVDTLYSEPRSDGTVVQVVVLPVSPSTPSGSTRWHPSDAPHDHDDRLDAMLYAMHTSYRRSPTADMPRFDQYL